MIHNEIPPEIAYYGQVNFIMETLRSSFIKKFEKMIFLKQICHKLFCITQITYLTKLLTGNIKNEYIYALLRMKMSSVRIRKLPVWI